MTRCGLGYDLHRLAPGRPLFLGGIELSLDNLVRIEPAPGASGGAGGTAASICRIDDRAHPHTALQCKAARKQMGSACP